MLSKTTSILNKYEERLEAGTDCYFIPQNRSISNELDYFRVHKCRYISILSHITSLFHETNTEESTCLDIGTNFFCIMLKEIYGFNLKSIYISGDWKGTLSKANIELKVCNLTKDFIPFEDNSFDFINFSEVIEHLPISPGMVLKQLNRILKPGGVMLLGTPNFACLSNRLYQATKILRGRNPQMIMGKQDKNDPHYREFTMDELIHLSESNGFKIIDTFYEMYWDINKPIYYRTVTRLIPQFRSGITVILKKDK